MIMPTLEELRQRQRMNRNSYPKETEPLTSSSLHDESPLRAFLLSSRSGIDPKETLKNKVSSIDLDLLAPRPLPTTRSNLIQNKREGRAMNIGETQKSNFSFFDDMAQGGKVHHRNVPGEILPMRQDTDVFMHANREKGQSLMHESCPSFPQEVLEDLKPTPIKKFDGNERKQPDEMLNVESKEEAMQSLKQSYDTLNKLMQRTASSRCFLLEQSKKNNRPLKSLSTSAFKTIVSSTKITSSISATSFGKITTVPETFTTSDCINSSFGEIIQFNEHQPKKRRTVPVKNHNLFASTLNSSRNSGDLRQVSEKSAIDQSELSLMNSLPSCGSLSSACSESVHTFEHTFEQAIQKSPPFPPFEITTATQVTPVGEKEILCRGSIPTNLCSGGVQSFENLDNLRSLAVKQRIDQVIQTVASSSSELEMNSPFQTRNKFNSSQIPNGKIERPSSTSRLGMSNSFQTRNKFNSFQALPGKIDQSKSSLGLGRSNSLRTRNKLNPFQTTLSKMERTTSSSGLGMNSSFHTRNKFKSFHGFPAKIDQSSSSLELGASNSFQSKRKFNSFQATTSMSDQSSRYSIRDSSFGSLGDLPQLFVTQGNISRNTKSDKISQTMKQKLRRELQRPTTKSDLHGQSNSTWLPNNNL